MSAPLTAAAGKRQGPQSRVTIKVTVRRHRAHRLARGSSDQLVVDGRQHRLSVSVRRKERQQQPDRLLVTLRQASR